MIESDSIDCSSDCCTQATLHLWYNESYYATITFYRIKVSAAGSPDERTKSCHDVMCLKPASLFPHFLKNRHITCVCTAAYVHVRPTKINCFMLYFLSDFYYCSQQLSTHNISVCPYELCNLAEKIKPTK